MARWRLVSGQTLRRIAGLSLLLAAPAFGQFGSGDGPWRRFPNAPTLNDFPQERFSFCTVMYTQYRSEDLGFGWSTDWPDAGYNFMIRLEELTTIRINRDKSGEPVQVNLHLTDDSLFDYPYIFMSDVGVADFSEPEAEQLREYLLRGGFLHVDDFWGEEAWDSWRMQLEKVLPPDEYPIQDIPLSHPIFNIVFKITEKAQVPSIQYWRGTRDGTTSERGESTSEVHIRGIYDNNGRLMVVMTHNTDIADGWEKEREDHDYFEKFAVKKSYPLGINIVVYALTH